jgi:pimeloyl-ACP methyl ester carboxylesterase
VTSEASEHRFASFDGVDLAWQEMGEGRPLVLIHGLFSNAWTNWSRYGHAARLAAAGHRVIMPDLRGHGLSAHPHDPAAYPKDVQARDGLALLDHLGLQDFDLGGYSLGGRTVVRMLADGAEPRRAIVAGMGLSGLTDPEDRAGHFREIIVGLGKHERGSPEWLAEAFLKTTGTDPQAMLPLLDSFVATPEGALTRITLPMLVIMGQDDHDSGSGRALAELLPDGRYVEIPGNHMSAVVRCELSETIAEFLAA